MPDAARVLSSTVGHRCAYALEGLNGVSQRFGRGKLSGQQRSTTASESGRWGWLGISRSGILHSGADRVGCELHAPATVASCS